MKSPKGRLNRNDANPTLPAEPVTPSTYQPRPAPSMKIDEFEAKPARTYTRNGG